MSTTSGGANESENPVDFGTCSGVIAREEGKVCPKRGRGKKWTVGERSRKPFSILCVLVKKKKEGRKKGERKGDGCERQREFSANQKRILITRAEECRFRSGRPPVPFELMA